MTITTMALTLILLVELTPADLVLIAAAIGAVFLILYLARKGYFSGDD